MLQNGTLRGDREFEGAVAGLRFECKRSAQARGWFRRRETREEASISNRVHLIRREGGFTIIELLVTVALGAILMTLGASAFRAYWFSSSLASTQDLMLTEMRAMQERAVSESHPLVYGLRFQESSGRWAEVVYDPKDQSITSDDVCEYVGGDPAVKDFEAGIVVRSADFTDPPGLSVSKCPGSSNGKFAFFYAKGTATAGNVTFLQPNTMKELGLQLSSLTGRVTKQ